jgi:hypothetical protein
VPSHGGTDKCARRWLHWQSAALCFQYLHLMRTLQEQAAGKAIIEVVTERARLRGRPLILGHRHAARTE